MYTNHLIVLLWSKDSDWGGTPGWHIFTYQGGSDKPKEECEEGCIYRRYASQDDEYCFKNEETNGLVQCEVVWYS